MSEYITKVELEKFKQELITELKHTEIELKENSNGQLLKPVYNKWIHCTRYSQTKNQEKPFKKNFSTPHVWKVWDAIRGLTCAVCGVKQVASINDAGLALDFCEKLCEFIDTYMQERKAGKDE